jgi:hypothetical protein
MPVTTCAFSPALNRSQFGVLIGRDVAAHRVRWQGEKVLDLF